MLLLFGQKWTYFKSPFITVFLSGPKINQMVLRYTRLHQLRVAVNLGLRKIHLPQSLHNMTNLFGISLRIPFKTWKQM